MEKKTIIMLKQKIMHEYDFPPYLSKSYMALSFATISVTKKKKLCYNFNDSNLVKAELVALM